jgi:hypothetical protein
MSEYVFAAYGEFLYAWNAIDGANEGVSITELPYERVNMCNFTTVEATATPLEVHSNATAVQEEEEQCYSYQPKPTFVALLLHKDRLTAIVSEDTYTYSSSGELTNWTPKIISDFTRLTIRIYDVSSVPMDNSPLKLLAKSEKSIMADYVDARSNKMNGILTVASYIDTYSLVGDLHRGSNPQYCGLNSTEYTKLAVETASNRTEPFVESMLEELLLQLDGTCSNIVQVSVPNPHDKNPYQCTLLCNCLPSSPIYLKKDFYYAIWREYPRCQQWLTIGRFHASLQF